MISFFGKCVNNLYKSIYYLVTGRSRVSHVLAQAAAISYDSLLISLVIAFVSAAVIAIQVSKQFLMSGAEAYVGGSIAVVMIREIAPGFVALAIGARAGTGNFCGNCKYAGYISGRRHKNIEGRTCRILFCAKNTCCCYYCPNGCAYCRISRNYRWAPGFKRNNSSSSCKVYKLGMVMAECQRYLYKSAKGIRFWSAYCTCLRNTRV